MAVQYKGGMYHGAVVLRKTVQCCPDATLRGYDTGDLAQWYLDIMLRVFVLPYSRNTILPW